MKEAGRSLGLVLAVFGLLYNVSFLVAPSVSTGRVALLLLLLWTGRRGVEEVIAFLRIHWVESALFAIVTLYQCVLYVSASFADFTQLSRLIHLALFAGVGGLVVAVACRLEILRFVEAFTAAVTLQSLFIGYSFASAGYREWLSSLVIQGGNVPLTSGFQPPGFSNGAGAALSLIQGLGVFTALYGVRFAPRARERLLFGIAGVANALSTLVVARTGMQMALVFVLVFALTGGVGTLMRYAGIATTVVIVVALIGGRIVTALTDVNPKLPASLERDVRLFLEGRQEASFRELLSQPVPALNVETVLGTGLVAAPDRVRNASGNDSGYIETYFALGLPMATVFYAMMLMLTSLLWARTHYEPLLGALIGVMFVVELKEPFMFKYAYPFLALTLLWLRQGVALTHSS